MRRRPRILLIALAYAVLSGCSGEPARPDLEKNFTREAREVASGLTHIHFQSDHPEHWNIHVLEADLRRVRMRLAIGKDHVTGKEPTGSLAERYGALAAVNAGFFEMEGAYQGEIDGFFVLEGAILSEPTDRRGTFGFCNGPDAQTPVFDWPKLQVKLVSDGENLVDITGINRARGDADVVLYTPEFGPSTLTEGSGVEVVVEEGKVSALSAAGNRPIPSNGFVLSASGEENVRSVSSKLQMGSSVAVSPKVAARGGEPFEIENCSYTSAGPMLLQNGEALSEYEAESGKFRPDFTLKRHPRTAVGRKADGTLIFVVVDGRQPALSAGMSLPELTDLMQQLGAVGAYNLDGGGSTTMVVNGEIVNSPSDLTGERPVSDAILLFPR